MFDANNDRRKTKSTNTPVKGKYWKRPSLFMLSYNFAPLTNSIISSHRQALQMEERLREGLEWLTGHGFQVGNFRQKNCSAEDSIDEINVYFRWNSGCSAEQKILGILVEKNAQNRNRSKLSKFCSGAFLGIENSS